MNHFLVALLQLAPAENAEENQNKGLTACRKAKAMGADLAVFPEMWHIGYRAPFTANKAIAADSAFCESYRRAAKELQMGIAITFLEKRGAELLNTVRVFDRFGQTVLTYSKVHTCAFGDERVLTPGSGFFVGDLDIGHTVVKLGAMICFDREFPESARILMLQGAEIILVPNACPMELNRLAQLRTRAYENMVGIATCNYAYGQPDCNGHSTAFDGMAYGEIRPGVVESRDTLILEAGEAEGIYLARFPLEKLRQYRQEEVHGNAYRRPRLYGLLTGEAVAEPFVRPDRRP